MDVSRAAHLPPWHSDELPFIIMMIIIFKRLMPIALQGVLHTVL